MNCPTPCPSCAGMRVVMAWDQVVAHWSEIRRAHARVTPHFWWRFWKLFPCLGGPIRWGTYAVVEMSYEEAHRV